MENKCDCWRNNYWCNISYCGKDIFKPEIKEQPTMQPNKISVEAERNRFEIEICVLCNNKDHDEKDIIVAAMEGIEGKIPDCTIMGFPKNNAPQPQPTHTIDEEDESENLLREAVLQIRYLGEKFGDTGSSNAVVARIERYLNQISI